MFYQSISEFKLYFTKHFHLINRINVYSQKWTEAVELLEKGAECDYVSENGWSGIHGAADSGGNVVVEKILEKRKEELERRERNMDGVWDETIRGWNNRDGNIETAVVVVGGGQRPVLKIFSSKWTPDDVEKVEELFTKVMERHAKENNEPDIGRHIYNTIRNDFQFIKEKGHTSNQWIVKNIPNLIEICSKRYNVNVKQIIQQTFGNKFYESEPLTWRFGAKDNPKNLTFVAAEFKKCLIDTDIVIKDDNGVIKVTLGRNIN